MRFFLHTILFCLLICGNYAFGVVGASGDVISNYNATGSARIGVNIFSSGNPIESSSPSTLIDIASRFPKANISIDVYSVTHNPVPIYKLSVGPSGVKIGESTVIIESNGKVWILLDFNMRGVGEGFKGEVLISCGENHPHSTVPSIQSSHGIEIEPFTYGSGSLKSLGGVVGQFSLTASCSVVAGNGSFGWMLDGTAVISGIWYMDSFIFEPGTVIAYDLAAIIEFQSKNGAFWFKW